MKTNIVPTGDLDMPGIDEPAAPFRKLELRSAVRGAELARWSRVVTGMQAV